MATTMASSSSSSRAGLDNTPLYRTRCSSQSLSSGFASSTAVLSRSSSSSTTCVSFYESSSPSPPSTPPSKSVRYTLGRRSISVTKQRNGGVGHGNGNGSVSNKSKKTCMCSPTTHPGSFRCSLHKNSPRGGLQQQTPSSHSNSRRLSLMRSAMANSLIRIGAVEGDIIKRSLSALIRPSSHQQRRRTACQPRQSRLSVMSKAEDS